MINFKIAKVLAKDLLQKESKYIEDEQLIFNRIVIKSAGACDCTADLYYGTQLLASIKLDCCPGPYTTFDFILNDSNMKLHFDEGDLLESSDSPSYKRINKATTTLLKEIEAWKDEQ